MDLPAWVEASPAPADLRQRGAFAPSVLARAVQDARLAGRYGTATAEVKALIAFDGSLREPMVPGLRYLRAEAVYAVRHEMATTVVDVLTRRTRAHLEDRSACLRAATDLARLMADELGWIDDEVAAQVDEYRRLCNDELAAADRPDSRHARAAS